MGGLGGLSMMKWSKRSVLPGGVMFSIPTPLRVMVGSWSAGAIQPALQSRTAMRRVTAVRRIPPLPG